MGDILPRRAMLWAKADRPGRMLVRWSTTEDLSEARQALPVHALEDTDFTAKLDLMGLPADQRIRGLEPMLGNKEVKLVRISPEIIKPT